MKDQPSPAQQLVSSFLSIVAAMLREYKVVVNIRRRRRWLGNLQGKIPERVACLEVTRGVCL